jgi:predicted nucleic acid-binding protein
VIVVDASAGVAALLNAGPARQVLASEQLHAPHLVDSEVANALRRAAATHRLQDDVAWAALAAWSRLGMTRYPAHSLVRRIWELRDNVSAYDATYVALAEALSCPLLTADRRLARASGIGCPVTVVPR